MSCLCAIGVVFRSAALAAIAVLTAAAVAPAAAQTVTQFSIPTANAQPNSIVTGPDGALWFTEQSTGKIGRLATNGTFSEFAPPTANSSPTDIVVGPDGALWFIEGIGNIGRITTAGAVTEFPVIIPPLRNGPGDTVDGAIDGLTPGADGALHFFFANSSDNACVPVDGVNGVIEFARLTTAGTLTALEQCKILASSMTMGPDGNLWATSSFGNALGVSSITSSNTITSYPDPTGNSGNGNTQPSGIVTGPDGNLWLIGTPGNVITNVTIGGTFNHFSIPTFDSQPFNITAGPDGALWFTESQGVGQGGIPQIGRITTSGTITEFKAGPIGAFPVAITAGPDGAMWYPEQGLNAIGRITVPASVSPLVAAVLPASRSIAIGGTATAFATMINSGSSALSGCAISPVTTIPASFLYQTTNPSTNVLTGSANTPATIAAGGSQSFVIAFTANGALAPTNVVLGFACTGGDAAPSTIGLNTLLLSISATPVPDIVALAASGDPGIVDIPGANGAGAFAVASVNLGAGAAITVTADTGSASLPVTLTLCQTVPSTGACMAAPAASVATTINANATPTFAIFAQGSGTIPFSPAANRVFVRFTDSGGATRGSTSVAVRTQ